MRFKVNTYQLQKYCKNILQILFLQLLQIFHCKYPPIRGGILLQLELFGSNAAIPAVEIELLQLRGGSLE
jgi:hypothetical protein